jgi:hypothetical protein
MSGLSDIYNRYLASNAVSTYEEDERIFRTRFKRAAFAVFLVLSAASPLFADEGDFFILNLALVNLISALGLNILVGFTGLLSLGHAAFVGVGAYCSAPLYNEARYTFSPFGPSRRDRGGNCGNSRGDSLLEDKGDSTSWSRPWPSSSSSITP